MMMVRQEFERIGLHPEKVALGEVTLSEKSLTPDQVRALDAALLSFGFERMDDRKARVVEAIKSKIIDLIHYSGKVDLRVNWSTVLSREVNYEYSYISGLFSSIQGITLEQYIIRQKLEKVKELLFYDELTLSEIADRLGYSSVAHLSSQFKKITGFTPSELKKARQVVKDRKPLDSVP